MSVSQLYEITVKRKYVIGMYNIKLVTSLPMKFQQILSHGSQLGGKKHLRFLSMTSLKGNYQFYCDARTFS